MTNQGQKDKILRFVLESSPEENQRLVRFMAGIRTQGQPSRNNGKAEKTPNIRDPLFSSDIICRRGE
jgi:hypothetical protein